MVLFEGDDTGLKTEVLADEALISLTFLPVKLQLLLPNDLKSILTPFEINLMETFPRS